MTFYFAYGSNMARAAMARLMPVKKINAKPGDSLAVDAVILDFS